MAESLIPKLTPIENRIWRSLLEADGRVVSARTELKVYISRMRTKAGLEIENVHSVGYRLVSGRSCPTCGHVPEGPRLEY